MRATSTRTGAAVIDLNADLGEGAGTDNELLAVITSANVACGAHAGDLETINTVVRTAKALHVAIGAHPSFPDRAGFGRRPMALPSAQVTDTVATQIQLVADAAEKVGLRLQHVKPHGALYNQAASDPDLARAIGEAVRRVDASLIILALAGSQMADLLRTMGLRVAHEAFVDRGYTDAGTLVPRGQPGAVIIDPTGAAARAVQLATERAVTVSGRPIRIEADTLCLHGDTPHAPALAQAVRRALDGAGVRVARLDSFL
ncbi:MAG TPA: 5-oxoprolinase subunit PxpA [bacterium]|jgi:UPF0271 protein|nr:5-oxoprolinase subunit PxpA [bacterium]